MPKKYKSLNSSSSVDYGSVTDGETKENVEPALSSKSSKNQNNEIKIDINDSNLKQSLLPHNPSQQLSQLFDDAAARQTIDAKVRAILGGNEAVLTEIYDNIKFPRTIKQLDRKFGIILSLAVATSIISVIPYIDGSSSKGIEYVAGGAGDNGFQNCLYILIAIEAIQKLYPEKNYKAIAGMVLGGIAFSIPITAAEYFEFTDKVLWKAICTLVGSIPLNAFALVLSESHSKGREYYLNLLDSLLKNVPELKDVIRKKYSTPTKIISTLSGLGLGAYLASAQIGYLTMLQEVSYNRVWANRIFSNFVGIFFNLPAQKVAITFGLAVGEYITHKLADFCDAMKNIGIRNIVQQLLNDVKTAPGFNIFMNSASLVSAGGFSYLAFYSWATAEDLYKTYNPDWLQNSFYDSATHYGTVVFNLLPCLMLVDMLNEAVKMAYTVQRANTQNDSQAALQKTKFQVSAIQNKLINSSTADINKLIEKDTLTIEKKAELLKVEPNFVSKGFSYVKNTLVNCTSSIFCIENVGSDNVTDSDYTIVANSHQVADSALTNPTPNLAVSNDNPVKTVSDARGMKI